MAIRNKVSRAAARELVAPYFAKRKLLEDSDPSITTEQYEELQQAARHELHYMVGVLCFFGDLDAGTGDPNPKRKAVAP